MVNQNHRFNETLFEASFSLSNVTINSNYFNNIRNTCFGSVIFCAILPFLTIKLRILPYETPYFVLVGATLMIWSNVVSPGEFFNLMSLQEYISGLLLILGTTIIGDYYSREQFFSKAVRQLLREDQAFSNYHLRISCISFVISMLFSSDVSCLALTPIIFKCWEEQERTENELETIVLSISTSAILGGSALPFGNIALSFFATRKLPLRINMKSCFQYFMAPAIICFWLNYVFLSGLYHLRHKRRCKYFYRPWFCKKKVLSLSKEMCPDHYLNSSLNESALNDISHHGHNLGQLNGSLVKDDKHFHPPTLETIIEDEVLVLPATPTLTKLDSKSADLMISCMRPSMATEDLTTLDEEILTSSLSSGLTNSQLSNARNSEAQLISFHGQKHPLVLNWETGYSVAGLTMVHLLNHNQDFHEVQGANSTRQKILRTILIIVQLAVFVLQFISSFQPSCLDPGIISTGGAIVIMVLDALLNRRSLSSHFTSPGYKWGLPFVGFFSILVLIFGFFKTGLPHWAWNAMGLSRGPSRRFDSLFCLVLTSIMVVNVLGTAPATLIFMFLLSYSIDPILSSLSLSSSYSSLMMVSAFHSENDLTGSSSSSPSGSGHLFKLMLHLAWVISMAGMTTLNSSVANSLVAQKSHEILRAKVSYLHHLAYGLPASFLYGVIGISIISICLHVF